MRRLILLAVVVLATVAVAPAPAGAEEATEPHLVLFWADGCPYCEAERSFLDELRSRWPELAVAEYEVSHSDANRALFAATMAELGLEPQAVPTTIVGDRVWVGFDDGRAAEIEAMLESVLEAAEPPEEAGTDTVDVPLLGPVDVGSHSLLVATLIIGFVDGFNPCSLWVLSMLLALVLHTGSRRRVLAVGSVFLAVTTAMYGLYITGLYGVLNYVGYTSWIRLAIALLALVIGIINVKDFFAFGTGPSLSIPEAQKPKLIARMRPTAAADRPLAPMLLGVGGLAVGVSLLETPCTAGFPILWTDMLADHGVGFAAAAALFAVYMAVFLVDELVVFATAVVAMRVSKLQEHHGRALKLLGGTVMIALAAAMVAAPEIMTSVAGVVVVFAAGAALALGLFVAGRRLRVGRGSGRGAPHRAR